MHDLAAPAAGRRARGRGLHRDAGPARRAARRRRRRRRRAGAPAGAAAAVRAAGQPARAAGAAAAAAARAGTTSRTCTWGWSARSPSDAARVTIGAGAADGHDLALHARRARSRPCGRPGTSAAGPSGGVAMNAVSAGRGGRRCSASSATAGQVRGAAQRHRRRPRWAAPAGRPRGRDRRRHPGRVGDAAGRPQAAAAAAAGDAPRAGAGPAPPYRCTWTCSARGRSAAGWSGTSPGHGLAGVGRPPRPGRPRGAAATGTPPRTSTSPPAGWSRSASPPWRRGPPGCRSSAGRAAASRSSCWTASTGCSPPTTRRWRAAVARLVADARPARRDGRAQPRAPAGAVVGARRGRCRGRVRAGPVPGGCAVSAPRQAAPRIVLVGHERGQEPVVEAVLGHGEDPADVLARPRVGGRASPRPPRA